MKRREFITLLGGSAAWPLAARGQPEGRMRRVGVLMSAPRDTPRSNSITVVFEEGLRDLGSSDGHNIRIEYRWAGGEHERVQAYAAELVGMRPELIFCSGAPTLVALRKYTHEIPIVFAFVSDPVGMGEIDSLARPGGNATGFTPFAPSLGSKWIELLKELSPDLMQVGIIFNPDTAPNAASFVRSAERAAPLASLSVSPAPVRDNGEIEKTITRLARQAHTGAIAIPDPFALSRAELIGSLALSHSIPLVAPFREYAVAGGLASYGINILDEYRRAATYVNRILRGEKPGDLPVQAPTRFELIINMKSAEAQGLKVPPHLQQLADEVIE